ncbi:putative transmembrane protein [Toxoplasma gondii p89]|uniref:Putative transmembrane protein n=1 Tax=Toxoplasma gondii p89 TaxID=943119 RepID=A0A086KSV9_TOXGO|nr:putative transmembrane protein [Toxoplasma gondii p89]
MHRSVTTAAFRIPCQLRRVSRQTPLRLVLSVALVFVCFLPFFSRVFGPGLPGAAPASPGEENLLFLVRSFSLFTTLRDGGCVAAAEPAKTGVDVSRVSPKRSVSSSTPDASADPWLPSLDLVIPENQDKRETVYDVLASVENTPSDNLFFAIARDVVNTYQLTKPFLDEFLRLQQQQRAKQRAKNVEAIEDAGGIATNALSTNPKFPLSFTTPWGSEGDNENSWKIKKKRSGEKEAKNGQERRKNVRDRGDSDEEGRGKPHKSKILFGHQTGTARLLSATHEVDNEVSKRGKQKQIIH